MSRISAGRDNSGETMVYSMLRIEDVVFSIKQFDVVSLAGFYKIVEDASLKRWGVYMTKP